MSEINEQNLEAPPILPKRKPDLETLTPDPKKQKPEAPENQIPEQESHGKSASNGKSAIDKGKSVMKEDKGKGKLQVEESDSSSSSGEDEENEGEDGGDSDFLDDPLAEVDLSNILPSRTRRRAAQPGAYLVNDMDDEEDEDDDEDEEVVADEDDSD